jgi:hypothetical protein
MVALLRGPLLPERRCVVYFSYAKRSRIQKQRAQDKDLSDAEIQKQVNSIMNTKFSDLDLTSADARLLRLGLVEKEGGLRVSGVEFTCEDGFSSANLLAYPKPHREQIVKLVSSAEAQKELEGILGCSE